MWNPHLLQALQSVSANGGPNVRQASSKMLGLIWGKVTEWRKAWDISPLFPFTGGAA
jgi:hypothetical protein